VRRVLFDENLPRLLRRKLPEFEIRTVQEERWDPSETATCSGAPKAAST
jgi:hypothetical protein